MARRSARIASSQGSQASSSPPAASHASPPATARKRKAESGDSPSAKRGKKDQKEQKTIEESMDIEHDDKGTADPEENKSAEIDPPKETEQKQESAEKAEPEQTNGHANGSAHPEKELGQEAGAASADPDQAQKEIDSKPEASADKTDKAKDEEPSKSKESARSEAPAKSEEPAKPEESKPATNGDNAVETGAREDKVPSSILEKGIIYFLFRGRVNLDDPKNVQDLQRSFFVLRPIPHGAKIGDGAIGDDKNCRLIAIPKKMLPLSGNDRWTAFVETANVSFKDLKESFMKSNQYETQTGTSTTPAAAPVAEGVYAITTTGRETHLAYILTLPEKLGDIQNDLGLRQQGSFIVSVKNPKAPGPSNADLGQDPGYSQEILNSFRGLRWSPMRPEMLNYEACQFLLIGEGEKGLEKATETQPGDEKKDETPMEEIEKLEEEDEIRVEHLNGEDAVFADLGTNAKDYPALQTTW